MTEGIKNKLDDLKEIVDVFSDGGGLKNTAFRIIDEIKLDLTQLESKVRILIHGEK